MQRVVSVFKVLLKEGEENSVEVKADDTSVDDTGIEFWIDDMRVAFFNLKDIVGFYEIREEIYTELELESEEVEENGKDN